MKKTKSNFYDWLKVNINKPSTSTLLDEKILEIAKLKLEKKPNELWFYSLGSLASIFVIFLIGNVYLNQIKSFHSLALVEAPEMILIYDKIELMAEASNLSEEDWKQIEGKQ